MKRDFQRRPKELLGLLDKVSCHAANLVSGDGVAAPGWAKLNFLQRPDRALRAYINVLSYWGYGYDWQSTVNHMGAECTVVTHDEVLVAVAGHTEMQFVMGFPFRFSVSFLGATWSFDETHGTIRVTHRTLREGEPLTSSFGLTAKEAELRRLHGNG
jgi:hypothetical protein